MCLTEGGVLHMKKLTVAMENYLEATMSFPRGTQELECQIYPNGWGLQKPASIMLCPPLPVRDLLLMRNTKRSF